MKNRLTLNIRVYNIDISLLYTPTMSPHGTEILFHSVSCKYVRYTRYLMCYNKSVGHILIGVAVSDMNVSICSTPGMDCYDAIQA